MITLLGLSLWFIRFLPEAKGDALALAQFSATVGGFFLVGSFLEKIQGVLRRQIAWVAKLSFVAALGFLSLELFVPALRQTGLSSYSTTVLVVIVVAAEIVTWFAFVTAIGLLVYSLHRLRL